MKKKLIVKRAKVLGYCFGVKKAVDASLNAAELRPHKNVFTFGPLIHNPATLKDLAQRGVFALDPSKKIDADTCANTQVIIRAHGISPQKQSELQQSGANIIDATCPKVKRNQKQAAQYAEQGHTVIIAGDRNHGEVVGIEGYVNSAKKNTCVVVQNAEEAKQVELPNSSQPVLMAQTTIRHAEYAAITEVLQERFPDLIVINSICSATTQRVKALLELAKSVEAILVIGGKNSANTRRLLHTAQDIPKPAWLIENKDEIPKEIFDFNSVGITAGASTPEFIIKEIEAVLSGE